MDGHGGVDGDALRHRDGAAHQVIFRCFAEHTPGQGGVAAESLLIEEVAPAAAALSDEEAHAGQVEHGQHRHAPPFAGQAAEHKGADDAAVDGQTAVADGQHIPDGIVIIGCHRHIIQAGAGDAQHHADEDDIHHRIGVDAELRAAAERKDQCEAEAEGDADAVPINIHVADAEGHPAQLKAEAEARELYQIRHSSVSSSSSSSTAAPSGSMYITAIRSGRRMCCNAASASSAVRPASMVICWATV